jgi:hypothetical protein
MGWPNARNLKQVLQSITTEVVLQTGGGRIWDVVIQFAGKNAGQIAVTFRDGAVADGSGRLLGTFTSGLAAAAGQGYVVPIEVYGLQFNAGLTAALTTVNGTPPGTNLDGAVSALIEQL